MTDDSELVRRHEGAAVTIIQGVDAVLASARQAAEHGDYAGALKHVRDVRDRLYFAETELRKAEMAARRKST